MVKTLKGLVRVTSILIGRDSGESEIVETVRPEGAKPSGLYRCEKCGYEFYSYAKNPDCSKCRTTQLTLVKELPVEEVKRLQRGK